jgi:hypothetical protein
MARLYPEQHRSNSRASSFLRRVGQQLICAITFVSVHVVKCKEMLMAVDFYDVTRMWFMPITHVIVGRLPDKSSHECTVAWREGLTRKLTGKLFSTGVWTLWLEWKDVEP